MWKPEDLSADSRVRVLGRPLPLSPALRLSGLRRTDRFSLRFCDPQPTYLWKLVVQFQESVTDTICDIIPGSYTQIMNTHTNTHVYCVYMLYACVYVYAYKHTYLHNGCFVKLITVNFIFVYPLLEYISNYYYTREWILWLCSVLLLNSSNYLTVLNKYFREKILKL